MADELAVLRAATGPRQAATREPAPGDTAGRLAAVERRVREVSHDLRQSVAAIIALASVARLQTNPGDILTQQLSTISDEARRVSSLCRQLVHETLTTAPVRLDEVAIQAGARAKARFAGELVIRVEPTTLVADELSWWRTLGNLLDNACRAAGARGRVDLTVRQARTTAVIDVEDSGPGFGEAEPGSDGVGLAIVLRSVHDQGGHLEVRQSPLGGALVRVVVPTAREARAGRPEDVAGEGRVGT